MAAAVMLSAVRLSAQEAVSRPQQPETGPVEVLSQSRWREVDRSVRRGLAWLAAHQSTDGYFPTLRGGQPGVTSLATLAFLSHGDTLDGGAYADALRRAIDYVLTCHKKDGLICLDRPAAGDELNKPTRTGAYTHAISGLMLCEVYGASSKYWDRDLRETIDTAVQFTLRLQKLPRKYPIERGG